MNFIHKLGNKTTARGGPTNVRKGVAGKTVGAPRRR